MCLRGLVCLAAAAIGCAPAAEGLPSPVMGPAPLVLGQTLHVDSKILGQRRVINVYLPPGYAQGTERYPVLYMPDGGAQEDFPHIMGTIDVSIRNEVIRPMLVVGIENIERRHDLVGPSEVADDLKAAPHAGGADRFRAFLREELKPYIAAHYRVTRESAIVGESLAGLFVLETLLVEPDLFDGYLAADPSVWWNAQHLVRGAAARFAAWSAGPKALYIATSEEPSTRDGVELLVTALRATPPPGLVWHYEPMPDEHHSTIYPLASVKGFRALFALPRPAPPR